LAGDETGLVAQLHARVAAAQLRVTSRYREMCARGLLRSREQTLALVADMSV
jgi:hypothetical protein